MNYKRKKWTVLVYSLILVVLALLMALVVLNNTVVLQNEYNYNKLNNNLFQNVLSKWKLAVKFNNLLNSNGSWFVDVISCPDDVTMSWSLVRNTNLATTLTQSGSDIFCQWVHDGKNFQLLFNEDFNEIVTARFENISNTLAITANRSSTFTDPNGTVMTFAETSFKKPDGFDDNINSDNYSPNSIWNIEYPNGIKDDDNENTLTVYWFVSPNIKAQNIYWTNSKMASYMQKVDSWTWWYKWVWTWTWVLYFDLDKDYELDIYRFDKERFDDIWEMRVTQEYISTSQSWSIWYLQTNMTLSETKTWNEFIFDFVNHDYGLFLKNLWDTALFYRVRWETGSGEPLQLVAIDDRRINSTKVWIWEIQKTSVWDFVYKQFEVVEKKEHVSPACEVWAHTIDNGITCDSDVRSCTISNGTATQLWNNGTSSWWTCVVQGCDVWYYSSDGSTCTPVWAWYYSANNLITRSACTNDPDTASRDYSYTGNWWGIDNCSSTYSDLCWVDLYETSNGVCDPVGNSYYAANLSNARSSCSNGPSNSSYTSDGWWVNSCSWTCDSGYTDLWSTCEITSWNTGSWWTCSLTCWWWTQTRSVTCQTAWWSTIADGFCSWTKPTDTQPCNTQSCCTDVSWTYDKPNVRKISNCWTIVPQVWTAYEYAKSPRSCFERHDANHWSRYWLNWVIMDANRCEAWSPVTWNYDCNSCSQWWCGSPTFTYRVRCLVDPTN